MASKELVQKAYDCFATGDMDTFRTLYHTDVVVKTNGMHKFSGTYNGLDNWMNNMVMHVPSHFENFKIDKKLALELNKIFLEVVVANGFDKKALKILKSKKNLRLIDSSKISFDEIWKFNSLDNFTLMQSEDKNVYSS